MCVVGGALAAVATLCTASWRCMHCAGVCSHGGEPLLQNQKQQYTENATQLAAALEQLHGLLEGCQCHPSGGTAAAAGGGGGGGAAVTAAAAAAGDAAAAADGDAGGAGGGDAGCSQMRSLESICWAVLVSSLLQCCS
ncbi:hypothetical protein COO60DRAFT_354666 [Scenedesmus sp. NREL 46B-D3]|nr:hypothetical protein COO60DRAFT_354666 [Scenedesmus sp. NREL 46B-D3]